MPRTKKEQKENRIDEVKDLGLSDEKAESKVKDEEKMLSVSPTGKFIVLEVVGGYRVAKNRQWVSPVLDNKKATTLASDLNRKDPEQKPYNRYLMGKEVPMRGKGDIQEM
jgi:hypothetical protein